MGGREARAVRGGMRGGRDRQRRERLRGER